VRGFRHELVTQQEDSLRKDSLANDPTRSSSFACGFSVTFKTTREVTSRVGDARLFAPTPQCRPVKARLAPWGPTIHTYLPVRCEKAVAQDLAQLLSPSPARPRDHRRSPCRDARPDLLPSGSSVSGPSISSPWGTRWFFSAAPTAPHTFSPSPNRLPGPPLARHWMAGP
jgi:hypothetical protein